MYLAKTDRRLEKQYQEQQVEGKRGPKEEKLGYKCELCCTLPYKPLFETPECLSLLTQVAVTRETACLTKSKTWNTATFQQGIQM